MLPGMKSPLFAATVGLLLLCGSAALAEDPKPVEIIRGPKRGPAKKTADTMDQQPAPSKADASLKVKAEALDARESALNARESQVKEREESAAKADDAARAKAEADKKEKAKREKALEDLAKKTHGEFSNAADALAGE